MSESEILSGESEAASAELLAPRHARPAPPRPGVLVPVRAPGLDMWGCWCPRVHFSFLMIDARRRHDDGWLRNVAEHYYPL